jgi:hypothetical protein
MAIRMKDSDFISYFIHCSPREKDNENKNEIQVSYIKHCGTLPLGHWGGVRGGGEGNILF